MKKHLLKIIILVVLVILPNINSTGAYFSDEETLTGITISTGCWTAPSAPSLVYPTNGYNATIGSEWLANPYMDWDNSEGCPGKTITYQYESYHNAGLTSLAYRSGILSDSQIPAPGTPDGKYYWRVHAYNGETWSNWSDVWLLTVNRTPPLPPPSTPSPGDVVINEVYWMGSGGEDEWIELKNTTSTAINLSGWKINLGSGGTEFTLSGTVIGNGYYLITERAANLSAINDSIAPDQILAVVLPDAGRQLTLKNSSGGIIDQTPAGHWPAGSHTGGNRKSMERNSTPGNGTLDGSWHTCVDSHCNDTTYWDTEGNNYGTPKSANLSENDSTETNLNFYFGSDTSHVGFTVSGHDLSLFEKANYTITYDSDQTTQGIIGVLNVSGQSEVGAVNLFLGSCSEGGTCTANTGIKNINIEVKLTGPGEQTLTSSLSI